MRDTFEAIGGCAAHALTGGIGGDEGGGLLFQIQQLLVELVVFAIRNLRLGQHVIGVVVPAEVRDEFGMAFSDLFGRHG
jgi:hypothetical protein